MVYWPSGFLEAVPRPKNYTFSGKDWFIGLAARHGQETSIFLTKCGFLAWYPGPPKNRLANKPLRDPKDSAPIPFQTGATRSHPLFGF